MKRAFVKSLLNTAWAAGLVVVIGCSSTSDSADTNKDAATEASNDAIADALDDAASTETGRSETGPNETGPNETGPNETGPNETGPNETGPGETGPEAIAEVSSCFGFASEADRPRNYCKAERIAITYDSAESKLTMLHTRVKSNCCGRRELLHTVTASTLVIEEIDSPPNEDGTGRCYCNCAIDYRLTLKNLNPGSYRVIVRRQVPDVDPEFKNLLKNPLDITIPFDGVKTEVVDNTPLEQAVCDNKDALP